MCFFVGSLASGVGFRFALPHVRRISLGLFILGSLSFILASSSLLLSSSHAQYAFHSVAGMVLAFSLDWLSSFFLLMIAIVSLATCIYSFGYVEQYASPAKKNLLVALMGLFILSMVLVVAAGDLLGFFFFWELMAMASFLLVSFDYEKKETRVAAVYYLVMTQLSTLFLLGAIGIFYAVSGTFEMGVISALSPFMVSLSFVFLCISFGIKAGAMPLHKWLPYAHPAAPSNISALMSGLMIKVAIYGLLRFLLFVLPDHQLWWGVLIMSLGTLSAILGVIYALKEHDIKRLLAYHSIENIGIILMGIGAYLIFEISGFAAIANLALAAALFHSLNHALFKSLLFLAAGSAAHATHTKNIEEMGGLIHAMPVTAVLFLIGAVSISAIPPFNGFVSELLLYQVFFQASVLTNPMLKIFLVLCAALFALTSALAAACFVKAFGAIFLAKPRSQEARHAKEPGLPMLIGPAVLAVLCACIGIFSLQITSALGLSLPIPNLVLIGFALVLVYSVALVALAGMGIRRTSETWGCGYVFGDELTEYTASGFSEPILRIFSPVFRPNRRSTMRYSDSESVNVVTGSVGIDLMNYFERYLYSPVAGAVVSIAHYVSRFQEVDLDTYVSYVFIASLLIVLVMRFFI